MTGLEPAKVLEEQPVEAGDDPTAPRPPTSDEILKMMAEAEARSAKKQPPIGVDRWNVVTFGLLWGGAVIAILSLGFLAANLGGGSGLSLLAAGGVLAAIVAVLGARLMGAHSPALFAGAMLRRAVGKSTVKAAELAGAEILTALGLAERVLDADDDARLVTRRDGVVTYANRAYFDLAAKAGVIGPAGLPPRIDRLFAQQGAEATKVFRLARAAKSGECAEEMIYQLMGLEGGGERRRFAVSVRPIRDSDEHVCWRLRELPVEEEEHDALAAAYADYPTPVFALEKSGQLAWANAALRESLGASRGELRHIDDFVLGETADIVRAAWKLDRTPLKAMLRRKNDDPIEGVLIGFRRGGVGEGFACVALEIDDADDDATEVALTGDVSESPFGVAVVEGEINRDGRIVEANKAFTDVFGGSKKNAPLSKSIDQSALEELAVEIRRKAKTGGSPAPIEASVGVGAKQKTFSIYARPVRRRRGAYGARRTLLYTVDVSERKRMEQDHAQDQKLRGIGELASKVAHDFNNYLQVVLGHCERLMLKHPAGDPAYQELVQIRENAQRAANTTKQLLAFSRKQTLKREVLSITEVLRDFSRFLTRAIGEKVKLEVINGRSLPPIKADRYQLETAIMNLAVNARDAMAPKGGLLKISTKAISELDLATEVVPDLQPGAYLKIDIEDTGPGIAKEIADKIFDPFFTTKDSGKGTGLGLSTVYGVIKQMDGAIAVVSEEGKGARFSIYLPAYEGVEEEADTTPQKRAEPADLTGAGSILVVEDEDPVRNFVVATLKDCGYQVTEAEDGEEALELIQDGGEFDLVISDVMMPDLDGPSMVLRARENHGLKSPVIFMSAYAESAVREQLDVVDGAGYIQKPFTLKSVATLVKQTLYPSGGAEK